MSALPHPVGGLIRLDSRAIKAPLLSHDLDLSLQFCAPFSKKLEREFFDIEISSLCDHLPKTLCNQIPRWRRRSREPVAIQPKRTPRRRDLNPLPPASPTRRGSLGLPRWWSVRTWLTRRAHKASLTVMAVSGCRCPMSQIAHALISRANAIQCPPQKSTAQSKVATP